ncbi:MAG: Ribose-5-phosphate isomerase B [Parcubacteria group bacterium GW2011_GWF2_38_76]|nr:MAG: Ribose-5-phosphate isomerase B [Parcubacteria group bacterium GW2011_GWF2_38_76]HBM46055.1 ribose-5-phosphate isomerase [Patescibacteria group bacterium]
MKIFISSDHAGFNLKETLVKYLQDLGHSVVDKGPFNLDLNDDYPDYISLTAIEVSKDSEARGIILGGSGQGEAMVANRFKGVRASVYYGGALDMIKVTREHNDSNIISLGARFMTEDEARVAVKTWLDTPFTNEERHMRRIKKIDNYPN